MSAFDPELLKYIETHSMSSEYHGYGYDQSAHKIAKTLMIEMVKSGHAAFLLLRDDEIAKWWGGMVNTARKAVEAKRERLRIYEIKKAAWDRLTVEERKILGIARVPTKPKS